MINNLLLDEIFNKIEFKIQPDQNIRKKYIYRLKKKFYKPAAYSVSKSAILNFTKYLSVYWAKKNIRVNNLIIGGMKNKQNKTFVKKYSNKVPIGRMAKVNEYNGPVLFLSSDLSSYMTGSSLIVDGGWTSI